MLCLNLANACKWLIFSCNNIVKYIISIFLVYKDQAWRFHFDIRMFMTFQLLTSLYFYKSNTWWRSSFDSFWHHQLLTGFITNFWHHYILFYHCIACAHSNRHILNTGKYEPAFQKCTLNTFCNVKKFKTKLCAYMFAKICPWDKVL